MKQFQKILNLRAIDLELKINKFFGVYHVVNLRAIRKWTFFIYCFVITSLVYVLYPALELVDTLFFCKTINEFSQNLCLTTIHLLNVYKVFNLVMRRRKMEDIVNLLKYTENEFVDTKEKAQSSKLMLTSRFLIFINI